MPRKPEGSRPLTNAERAARKRLRKASQEQKLVAALEEFSRMAFETTDPDPAYARAYAHIANYVRNRAREALAPDLPTEQGEEAIETYKRGSNDR